MYNTSTAYSIVKTDVAFFRNSIGILEFRGNDCLDFLNRLSTNLVLNLRPEHGTATILTNAKGRIIETLTLLQQHESLLVLLSLESISDVVRWLRTYLIMDDVKISNLSGEYTTIELHGRNAFALAERLYGNEPNIGIMFQSEKISKGGGDGIIYRAPAIEELCCVLVIKNESVENVLQTLQENNIAELSALDREILRIEAGMGAKGAELTEGYNPLEAGLLHWVNFRKGCYIGQEVIARLDSYNKVKQKIMGLTSNREIPVAAELSVDGKIVGVVTSSCLSPDFGQIALGYVRREFALAGEEISCKDNDGSIFPVGIVDLPFSTADGI